MSPSNETHDRVYKADLYARAAVPYYSIVNPTEHLLEAFSSEAGRWLRLGAWDGGTARIPPFDAIELDVSALFPPIST